MFHPVDAITRHHDIPDALVLIQTHLHKVEDGFLVVLGKPVFHHRQIL